MATYEYRVEPAPDRPERRKGVKGAAARYAATLAQLMNELGRDGWTYHRSDTLTFQDRSGWLSRATTVTVQMLVFRRARAADAAARIASSPGPAHGPAQGQMQASAPSPTAGVLSHRTPGPVPAPIVRETTPEALGRDLTPRRPMLAPVPDDEPRAIRQPPGARIGAAPRRDVLRPTLAAPPIGRGAPDPD